jgi:hypothetical protein
MAGLLSKLFGVRTVDASLGILDLSNGGASDTAASDEAALGPLFQSVTRSTRRPPECGVLLVYGTFGGDGRIADYPLSLRELVRDSKAAVVVVATDNPITSYEPAAARREYGQANLVLTLHRKGRAFPTFFGKLFAEMRQGTSMPSAWVKLAPHTSGVGTEEDLPDTLFLCEAGKVALA